jgi:hypothetical protein
MSTVWSVELASRTGTAGDGDRDACLEKAVSAESRAETPGRDKGFDPKGLVGGGGRGCDGGPVKGIAEALLRSQGRDFERGSWSM